MKSILYITTQDIGIPEGVGIKNKIFSQVEAYSKLGFNAKLVAFDRGNIVLIDNTNSFKLIKKSIEIKSKRLSLYKEIKNIMNYENIDYIYIRYFFSDPFFINTLRLCKQHCEKILVEIPTYPYNGELPKNIKGKIVKSIDGFFSNKLKTYVDYIITFSEDRSIFGINTINIENGVNVEAICKKRIKNIRQELRLIGVANLSFWHGFDRVIEGLNKYYSEKRNIKVYFDIVGDGTEKRKLEDLVNKYKLGEYVKFKGMMKGSDLDEVFDNANIAIGSLGIHRLGIEGVSTLKVKEYFARGIPFIYSYKEKFIDSMNDQSYTIKMEANEGAIDIDQLIERYSKIENISTLSDDMRKFAERYLTWDYQVKKIIEKLNE